MTPRLAPWRRYRSQGRYRRQRLSSNGVVGNLPHLAGLQRCAHVMKIFARASRRWVIGKAITVP
jgi:hypothetical protein